MKTTWTLLITLCLVAIGFCEERNLYDEDGARSKDALSEAVNVEGYWIQPPKNYTKQIVEGPCKITAWSGPRRYNGFAPMVMFTVITITEGDRPTLEQFLSEMLDGVKKRRTNWSESKPQKMKINGLNALRISWSGIDRASKKWMHGVMIAFVDNSKFISAHTQDVEPFHIRSLELGEMSILTLKKKED